MFFELGSKNDEKKFFSKKSDSSTLWDVLVIFRPKKIFFLFTHEFKKHIFRTSWDIFLKSKSTTPNKNLILKWFFRSCNTNFLTVNMITPYFHNYSLPYRLKIQILVQKYGWERCFALVKNPKVIIIFSIPSCTLRNFLSYMVPIQVQQEFFL